MGTYHTSFWEPSYEGRTRRQRRGGPYRWYEPSCLADINIVLDMETAKATCAAERALADFAANDSQGLLGEGIARLLLRSDAIASSNIEGMRVGARRLLRAELFELQPDNLRFDKKAAEVLGSVRAMSSAVSWATDLPQLTVAAIEELHRMLAQGTDLEPYAGRLRDVQNWVGGSRWNPFDARYVPPEPECVPHLMEDLCAFCARQDLPPLVQVALVHAQFESIHPFVDGNGRVGRALVHTMLLRTGLCQTSTPPVSLVLATNRAGYFSALAAMQSWTTDDELQEAAAPWIRTFSEAVYDACEQAMGFEREIKAIREDWDSALAQVGSNETMGLVMDALATYPIFTVGLMSEAIGRSFRATNDAVARLADTGIVQETSRGKRNRVFESPDMIEAFDIVERALASPSYDTSVEGPVRPVPFRER